MRRKDQCKKILSVSIDLISQKGFNGISFQEFGDKTRLHKSSLFHYFKSNEELLFRILERWFDKFYDNFQEIIGNHEVRPEEKLRKAVDNHLTLLVEYRANVNIFLNELRSLSRKHQKMHLMKIKKYEKDFEKIIVEMKTEGYFNGLDSKIVGFGILGMLNWVSRWVESSGRLAIKEISDIFYRMVTKKNSTFPLAS